MRVAACLKSTQVASLQVCPPTRTSKEPADPVTVPGTWMVNTPSWTATSISSKSLFIPG